MSKKGNRDDDVDERTINMEVFPNACHLKKSLRYLKRRK